MLYNIGNRNSLSYHSTAC